MLKKRENNFSTRSKLMANGEFGPELFHYTNANGLRGIFESGTMYATRYDCLNDRTEISHFKDILPNLVTERLSQDRELSSLLEKERHAARMVDQLYKIAFDTCSNEGCAVPYITSFCSHHDDHVYERDNGLLSQWRGYGGIERYALVFDTETLMRLAQQEYDAHAYAFRSFDKVIYNDDEAGKALEYAKLANDIVELIKADKNRDEAATEKWAERAYIGLVNCSTVFKHRAFSEEREVRMVFSPTTRLVHERYRKDPNYREEKPLKDIFNRTPNGVPTISMFEGLGLAKKLPLLRIIVGPSNDQKKALNIAKEITEDAVKIVLSETPFL